MTLKGKTNPRGTTQARVDMAIVFSDGEFMHETAPSWWVPTISMLGGKQRLKDHGFRELIGAEFPGVLSYHIESKTYVAWRYIGDLMVAIILPNLLELVRYIDRYPDPLMNEVPDLGSMEDTMERLAGAVEGLARVIANPGDAGD